jgi:hypothetical protein
MSEHKCPLSNIATTRREFVKHVGKHLEEVALAVLPMDDASDHSDADSDAFRTRERSASVWVGFAGRHQERVGGSMPFDWRDQPPEWSPTPQSPEMAGLKDEIYNVQGSTPGEEKYSTTSAGNTPGGMGEPGVELRLICDSCRRSSIDCDGLAPCSFCSLLQCSCTYFKELGMRDKSSDESGGKAAAFLDPPCNISKYTHSSGAIGRNST